MNDRERIPYPNPFSSLWEQFFIEGVANAEREIAIRQDSRECEPLKLLVGAEWPGPIDKAARVGASYTVLAYIGHRFGMNAEERTAWYKVAGCVPLSQAHAGTIIARINERDELFADLDKLTTTA
jgi:hypothetical protein